MSRERDAAVKVQSNLVTQSDANAAAKQEASAMEEGEMAEPEVNGKVVKIQTNYLPLCSSHVSFK